MKTIGVLTSGGDAPGMNAAVRAAVRGALSRGLKVKAIYKGYAGLMSGEIRDMDARAVSDIVNKGGTELFSARCLEFKEEEGVLRGVEACKAAGIDGIVVIGGDGSYRGARDLSERGLPCVGIPGTIDNDISSTEYTIGFDTAMNTAMEMVDRLRDTAQSHERCTIVEVMGRRAGYIALHTGIAVGATAVLVPEVPFDIEKDVIRKIENTKTSDKKHFIIVVAEGVGHVDELAKEIEAKCGIESRATVLGHVQRGGSPTVRDRVIASKMGHEAVQLLKKGIGNRVVCLNKGDIVDNDIFEALNEKKSYEFDLHKVAHDISI